jgi:DNA invertase Pin-like site-specific DNA recombinase
MLERTKSQSKLRCAIYTRKSTEEGLEQDFNTLHAQREACQAFIASQQHEGWTAIEAAYDDGGFSGGSIERPALKMLLADVRSGKIDVIVVYKVDRLTRSLTDFAKIVDVLDSHSVSFVSVTQAFNTTTSMGRLTLNVLLSFAQFEREVTGERIRDKIAASKKKGLWMGGFLPLGYKADGRRLIIDETEAGLVRTIVALYLKHGIVAAVETELARRKLLSPRRTAMTGRSYGGCLLSRGQIYRLLSNSIYIGEIAHKGARHQGQHKAIIDRETWDAVQAKLTSNARVRHVRSNAKDPSLLAGLLFDTRGRRFAPTHATKQGKRYRYYALQVGPDTDRTNARSWRIAASEIEGVVIERLNAALLDRLWLTDTLGLNQTTPTVIRRFLEGARALGRRLASPAGSDQRAALLGLLQGVIVAESEVRIRVRIDSLSAALSDLGNVESQESRAEISEKRGTGLANGLSNEGSVTLSVPVTFKRHGVESRLIIDGGQPSKRSRADPALIKVVARAHIWFGDLVRGQITMTEIATREGMKVSSVAKLLHLAFLAPDIVEAILEGNQAVTVIAHHLVRSNLPVFWKDQRAALLPSPVLPAEDGNAA